MEYPVTVDGVELSSVAWGVSTRTGWRMSPAVRASQVVTANGDGVLPSSRRAPLEAGQISLQMWVQGSDFADFTRKLDTLFAVFSTQRGLVPITLDVGNGIVRRAMGRTLASISPEHISPTHAKLTAVMEIPSGRWEAEDYTVAKALNVTSTTTLSPLCGDPTAEITDHVLLIRSGGTAVQYTVHDAGTSTISVQVRIPAPFSGGRSLLFDFANWRVYEISPRPDWADLTPEWFADLPAVLTDRTAQVLRSGPMYGRSLLPVLPGESSVPPRRPALGVSAIDSSGLAVTLPSVAWAVRAAWI